MTARSAITLARSASPASRTTSENWAVGALQRELGIPASTLTHHLSRLIWVELIHQRRDGRRLICSTDFEGMESMLAFLTRECCAGPEQRARIAKHLHAKA